MIITNFELSKFIDAGRCHRCFSIGVRTIIPSRSILFDPQNRPSIIDDRDRQTAIKVAIYRYSILSIKDRNRIDNYRKLPVIDKKESKSSDEL